MLRLLLVVSLLSCSCEGSVTCRDENGAPVDWWDNTYLDMSTSVMSQQHRSIPICSPGPVFYVPPHALSVTREHRTCSVRPPNKAGNMGPREHRDDPNNAFIFKTVITPADVAGVCVSRLCSDFCLLCFIRYILYKTPQNTIRGMDGLDYMYIYPGGPQNQAISRRNNKKINAADGILANTLAPILTNNVVSIILDTQIRLDSTLLSLHMSQVQSNKMLIASNQKCFSSNLNSYGTLCTMYYRTGITVQHGCV